MIGSHQTAGCEPERDGSCSICGDEGVLGEVVAVGSADSAIVRLPDSERVIATDLLDDVRPGDRLVIHLGFAIARVREPATTVPGDRTAKLEAP